MQGTHCTGKTGKMTKTIPCQGKHREFGNFAKTQGIWFAQVVNLPDSKGIRYFIFASIISKFLSWISLPSQLCVHIVTNVNWHRGNLQSDGKKTKKNRENTGNLKMQLKCGL